MESLEDATGSHSTRCSAINGAKKITGVIGVIVVALGFIFFGTRAESAAGSFTAAAVVGSSAAGGGLKRLVVFDQTARWMDLASFRRRRGRGYNVAACGHRLERCRLKQRPDVMM